MSQNFHKLYVAPLLVGIVTTVVSVVAGYHFSQQAAPHPVSPSPVLRPAELGGQNDSSEKELNFPKDLTTQALLREFLTDPVAAQSRHQGNEVRVVSLVALITSPGVIELYGATENNQVEGIYFECHLANGNPDSGSLIRNQLVTIRGKVASYVHHRKSPRIVLKSCSVVRP